MTLPSKCALTVMKAPYRRPLPVCQQRRRWSTSLQRSSAPAPACTPTDDDVTVSTAMQLPERTCLSPLGCAVLFNAWYAAPELRINRSPLNDLVLHITALERR